MHCLHPLGFSLQLPRVEKISNTPVHSVLGESFQQGTLNSHLVLIPPPSSQVEIEDALPLFLESLDHFLDAISAIGQSLLVPHVGIVLQMGEKFAEELVFKERTELMHEKTFKTASMDFLGRSLFHKGSDAYLVPSVFESTQSFLKGYLMCHTRLEEINKLSADSPLQPFI